MPRRRLVALAALVATLALAPAAHARIAPGLSARDAGAIASLARAHWPQMPCGTIVATSLPPAAMRGLAVAIDTRRSCTVVFNRGRRLSSVGWCQALYGVFKRMAAGSSESPWPYNCSLTVGPRPTTARLLRVPGLSATAVRRAYQVASAHWSVTSCRGREQLHWATPEQLNFGNSEAPIPGAVTLGEARLRDPHCVAYLNADVSVWTPGLLCLVLEHEFGHLKGLGHSPDPMNIMYPTAEHAPDCLKAFGELGPGESAPPAPDPAPEPAPDPAPAPAPSVPVTPGGFGGVGG